MRDVLDWLAMMTFVGVGIFICEEVGLPLTIAMFLLCHGVGR